MRIRRVGLALLSAVLAGVAAQILVHGLTTWAPCYGERLSCSMDAIVGMIVSGALTAAAAVLYGAIALWRPRASSLHVVLAVLLAIVAFLLFATLDHIRLLQDNWDFGFRLGWREMQQLLVYVAAPALVAIIPWATLLIYFAQRTAAGTPRP